MKEPIFTEADFAGISINPSPGSTSQYPADKIVRERFAEYCNAKIAPIIENLKHKIYELEPENKILIATLQAIREHMKHPLRDANWEFYLNELVSNALDWQK